MDEELRETLRALGIRTAGGLAILASEDVERRWGNEGLAAWRLARGDDPRRPVLTRLDAARAVSAELSPSTPTTEPILFLVRAALDRLVEELVSDGRAAAIVAITITLDDAGGSIPHRRRAHTITREVRLSRPLARVVPLLERCHALLDEWRLPAPACGVTVAITATTPLVGEQGELLDPAWRDPAAADAAFARLRATLGTSALVRPVLRDTHRPERVAAWERVDEPSRGLPSEGSHRDLELGQAIARALYEAHPAPVTRSDEREDGRPPHIRSRNSPGHPLALVQDDSDVAPRMMTAPHGMAPSTPARPSVPTRPATPTVPILAYRPATRHLDPPEPIEVQCEADAPRAIRWRAREMRVARAIGPERLTGDWWDSPYARDYWRCQDAGGAREFLIYRERSASSGGDRWFVQEWYD